MVLATVPNLAYVERPGDANYTSVGAASYPGLNFIPSGGSGGSFLAGTTPVTFPLAPDSKYYARWAGVSGIHDTLHFPSTALQLYGYSATFTPTASHFLTVK